MSFKPKSFKVRRNFKKPIQTVKKRKRNATLYFKV